MLLLVSIDAVSIAPNSPHKKKAITEIFIIRIDPHSSACPKNKDCSNYLPRLFQAILYLVLQPPLAPQGGIYNHLPNQVCFSILP